MAIKMLKKFREIIMKKGKQRVQLDMSENALLLLDELKEKTNSSSRAEVVRSAIIYYDSLVKIIKEKKIIIARNDDGIEERVIFPVL